MSRWQAHDIERIKNKGLVVEYDKPKDRNITVMHNGKTETVKVKKAMVHEESELQQNCVKVFRLMYPKYRMNFFSIPNGSYRTATEASIMSGEGCMPGACDTILTVLRGKYGAAFFEFKTSTGRLSEYQIQFIKAHQDHYYCCVIRTVEQFLKEVNYYLSLNTGKEQT